MYDFTSKIVFFDGFIVILYSIFRSYDGTKDEVMTFRTLCEVARNSVEKYASQVAFAMFGGEEVTYAEAGRRMAEVQRLLTHLSITLTDIYIFVL